MCTHTRQYKKKKRTTKKKKFSFYTTTTLHEKGAPVGGQTPFKEKLPRQLIIVIPNLSFSTMEDVITNIGNIPSKASGSFAFSSYIQVHLEGSFIKH